MRKVKFALVALFALASLSEVFGQEKTEEGMTIFTQGNREVEKASRITSLPTIVDTLIPAPSVEYPKLSLNFESDIQVDSIQSAEVKITDKLPQLYHSYAKIGISTEFMPIAEYYYNNTRSRKYHYGAHLKHISSFGNLRDYAPSTFDRNNANLYGTIIKKKYDLGAKLNLQNDGFSYYGFKNDSIEKDSIAHRYSNVGLSVDYNMHQKDSGEVYYRFGGDYNYFAGQKPAEDSLKDWRTQEHWVNVRGGAKYLLGIHHLDLNLSVQHLENSFGIQDSLLGVDLGTKYRNTLINLKPSFTTQMKDDRLKLMGALNITVNVAEKTKPHLYFLGEAKYSLFNNIFIPYVGLTGGMTQMSTRQLVAQNQFILQNNELRNENKQIEFYGGIKGTISKEVGFNISARFARIRDMALFVTDTLHPRLNQFKTIYDTVNMSVLEGSVYVLAGEKLKIDLIGKYYSYMLFNNSYAWHKPLMDLTLRGRYNLFNKLIMQADARIQAGRKALVYGVGEDVTFQNGQYLQSLGNVVDLNLSVEYLYNKRISGFLQFNNVIAQNYMRWYNYPVQGFQAMGGLSFKF